MTDSTSNQLALVPHTYQASLIHQRSGDGYINATAMCKAAGKKWNDYFRIGTTKAFLAELSTVAGIPATALVQSIQGGSPELQGTWIHPQVAIHLAQWLSPEFAVRVTEWVYEWMSGRHPSERVWRQFEDRISLVYDNVPLGYFCVFRAIADLFASMIANGADFGTRMILDISVGGCWAAHWKSAKLSDKFGEHAKFPHYYPGYFPQSFSNPQMANCYPEDAIPTFNRWLRDVYVPHKMPAYLKKLVSQKKLPPQIANNTLAALAAREAGRALPSPNR
ncbi:KilA-N domain-containing protein [Sphingobium phenoxybenzoativorans]|uniref:KilA-N domain-containing protein n=1 Tax=Sphingobium phenoxybenzoativorans TaxID=1592790 RepID=A0A975Q102_9SPHN|nr:KilA-N domain-containing protein [Sphingobium phenoxybenzoativorans]QUT04857.1 KilA-N domain-containing protein [Sphingobium phenoxybenzoativorans]